MPSERVQRQIDQLLDHAEAAVSARDWAAAIEAAQAVLAADPENADAKTFIAMAERVGAKGSSSRNPEPPMHPGPATTAAKRDELPPFFASGRYAVKKFLGEGGKKKVFLAHDNTLDRDVAFALIKAEGLDDTSRERITREAQSMGRLGDHPNIVPIFDLGIEPIPSPRRGEGGGTPGEGLGQPYMVLPLMSGGDVEGLIEKSRTLRPKGEKVAEGRMREKASTGSATGTVSGGPVGLSLERTLQIATDTCRGLVFAHSKGIVHRDL